MFKNVQKCFSSVLTVYIKETKGEKLIFKQAKNCFVVPSTVRQLILIYICLGLLSVTSSITNIHFISI